MIAHAAELDRVASPSAVHRLWGLDAIGLHDRLWASRGIQVVRRGSPEAIDQSGPALYLLLDADDCVIFHTGKLVKRLNWIRPRAVRLRIVDRERTAFVERVEADADGRLVAIRRQYRAAVRTTMRATLTPDAKLARSWAQAEDPGSWWKETRRRIGREAVYAQQFDGRIASSDEPPALFLEEIMTRFDRVGAAVQGVYEYATGIWVHETAKIDDEARLIAPLWIGAGTEVGADDVLIGPALAPDATPIEAAPIAWEEAIVHGFRVVPKRRRRRLYRLTKRLFDIAFALAMIGATMPIYPVVIVLIAIEDGWPPFFAHTRQTLRGRSFPCYKFRTMCKNAEEIKKKLLEERQNEIDGPQFHMARDPRVLRIGHWLRRFQVDELPQFWNVLLGHMSVVGPRPSPDSENQYCPAWREARLSVRPGVTGLWQVRRTREPETDFQEWIRFDLEYVQRMSWRLDIWIITQTIKSIVKG